MIINSYIDRNMREGSWPSRRLAPEAGLLAACGWNLANGRKSMTIFLCLLGLATGRQPESSRQKPEPGVEFWDMSSGRKNYMLCFMNNF
jgi:hypothetical protein